MDAVQCADLQTQPFHLCFKLQVVSEFEAELQGIMGQMQLAAWRAAHRLSDLFIIYLFLPISFQEC